MTEALEVLGWDDGWAEAFRDLGLTDAHPGRITVQHRDRWTIQSVLGTHVGRLLGSDSRSVRPVTGDWVGWSPGPHEADPCTIHSVLPRRSAVRRGSAGPSQSEQVLAANVDRLWIVQGLDRAPNLRSLERYLAVAWESGAAPEIVLSKSDLAEDLGASLEAVTAIAFGTRIWVVSVDDDAAVGALQDSLSRGETVALLGPSGVGKSTLVNHLAQSDVARTGEVREGDRKGRHTTTDRELFPIHNGALLLDTPGMRELRVLDVQEGLRQTFPDIEELAGDCRYRDCSHMSEPGCAVLGAAEEGRLSAARLASYRKLEAEAAYERRRADPQAQAEHVAEHKTAMRTMKYHHKYRDQG